MYTLSTRQHSALLLDSFLLLLLGRGIRVGAALSAGSLRGGPPSRPNNGRSQEYNKSKQRERGRGERKNIAADRVNRRARCNTLFFLLAPSPTTRLHTHVCQNKWKLMARMRVPPLLERKRIEGLGHFA